MKRKLIIAGLILVATPVLLLGLAWLIGAGLDAHHVASVEKDFAAPPEAVWALIHNFEQHPEWRPNVESVVIEREGNERIVCETNSFGVIKYRIDKEQAPVLLTTTIVDNVEFGGSWTFEIEQTTAGCRLRITEDGIIHGAVMRFIANHVTGLDATMQGYLGALDAKLN